MTINVPTDKCNFLLISQDITIERYHLHNFMTFQNTISGCSMRRLWGDDVRHHLYNTFQRH